MAMGAETFTQTLFWVCLQVFLDEADIDRSLTLTPRSVRLPSPVFCFSSVHPTTKQGKRAWPEVKDGEGGKLLKQFWGGA